MGSITPIGVVTLYKDVPFTNNYAHSIYFSRRSDQTTYFTSRKLGDPLTAQNYVKTENGKIRIEKNNNVIDNACYMSWDNAKVGDTVAPMTVYAFITNIDLVSANVVEITYEIDVLQTYLIGHTESNRILGECLIERRTPGSDDVGEHLEPEPVSFTNYVYQHGQHQDKWSTNYDTFRPLVFSTAELRAFKSESKIKNHIIWGKHGGIMQGPVVNVFKDMTSLDNFFGTFEMGGSSDDDYNELLNSIVAIIAVPQEFAVPATDFSSYDVDILGSVSTTDDIEFDSYISGKLGSETRLAGVTAGYSPRYNKLYTYPYNMASVTNSSGDELELRYEYFNTETARVTKFKLRYVVSIQPDFAIAVYPLNYAGKYKDFTKAMDVGQVPIVPFVTDSYQQWLGTSRSGAALSSVVSAIGGLASGNFLAMAGGFGNTVSLSDQAANARMAKDNVSTGFVAPKMLDGGLTIDCYQKCVNEIDARRIDDFFAEFGYAINAIQIPLGNGMVSSRNQLYIKTAGCIVKEGNCPAEFARRIEQIFNTGITWWKSNKVGQYN